jgi:cbb3-type cytochrome oxidase subunit 3
MNVTKLLISIGIIGLVSMLIGTVCKISHYPNADLFLMCGLIIFGIFWIATIWEIVNKKFINPINKTVWLFCVLIFPAVTTFVFHLKNRGENFA